MNTIKQLAETVVSSLRTTSKVIYLPLPWMIKRPDITKAGVIAMEPWIQLKEANEDDQILQVLTWEL